jgi:transcriptional regulator with XRE-family HTH domain
MTYDFAALRELRKRKGLTITELSQQAGVSPVALSKLERNQGNPELKTLDRIARALGVPTHGLIAIAERKRPTIVSERTQRVLDGATCRLVDLDGTRVCWVKAPRPAREPAPQNHGQDYEHCFVLDGRLKVTIRGSDFELGPGQALAWDCHFDHALEVVEPATFISVLVPKRP